MGRSRLLKRGLGHVEVAEVGLVQVELAEDSL